MYGTASFLCNDFKNHTFKIIVTSARGQWDNHVWHLLQGRGYEEVSRKLDVFEKMWEDGKLSYPVKATMAKLAIGGCKQSYRQTSNISRTKSPKLKYF